MYIYEKTTVLLTPKQTYYYYYHHHYYCRRRWYLHHYRYSCCVVVLLVSSSHFRVIWGEEANYQVLNCFTIRAKKQNLKSLKAMETWVCFGDVGLLTNCYCHHSQMITLPFYIQSVSIRFIHNQVVYRSLTCGNLRQLPLGKYVSQM